MVHRLHPTSFNPHCDNHRNVPAIIRSYIHTLYTYTYTTVLSTHTPTFAGTSFGMSGSVTVAGSVCAVASYSHTRVTCTLPEGDGLDNDVVLVAGLQYSNAYPFDFSGPSILSVYPTNGPTAGGVLVTVRGQNFGLSGSVYVGGQLCTGVEIYNHDRVQCRLPEGVGQSKELFVAGRSENSTASFFTYDGPLLTRVSPSNGPTAGGIPITLHGHNFGGGLTADVKATFFNGAVECAINDVSRDINHTALVCVLPSGISMTSVKVEVLAVQSQSLAFVYDGPIITRLRGCGLDSANSNVTINCPNNGYRASPGDTRVTVIGLNFGVKDLVVTVGGVACGDVVYETNHTQVSCVLPSGTGYSKEVYVEVEGESDMRPWLSYAHPEVAPDSLTFLPPKDNTTLDSTDGGELVRMYGLNFGHISDRVEVFYGPSDQPLLYTCPVVGERTNDTQIVCNTTVGVGKDLFFTVKVNTTQHGVLVSTPTQNNDYVSYPQPVIVANSIQTPTGVPSYELFGTSYDGFYVQFRVRLALFGIL